MEIELPKNASLAQTGAVTREVEQWLLSQPEVVNTFTTVGTTGKSFGLTPYIAEIMVFLTPLHQPREVSTHIFARQAKIALEARVAEAKIRVSAIDIL